MSHTLHTKLEELATRVAALEAAAKAKPKAAAKPKKK